MLQDKQDLQEFKEEIAEEFKQLLNWWGAYMQDHKHGGFHGKVLNNNQVVDAPKGLVLNARILYTYSVAHKFTPRDEYRAMADRAYDYLLKHFLDPVNGGFYWSVDVEGNKLEDKKQVYGQAFVIYALSAYYTITQREKILELAKETFQLLEKHSFDPKYLGYIEAHTADWQPIEDLRLSDKDQNDKKSMNTHLHVIEAYASLYAVWKDETLREAVEKLLDNFKRHIINPETHHLQLFFSENWEVQSTLVSFGHDIEAAWLLQEAAELIENEDSIIEFKDFALKLANAAARGLADNGGLYYEFDPENNHWIKEFHWWPQAEAMVGFLNAFEISGATADADRALACWKFIKTHLKDQAKGEWFWGVNDDYTVMQGEDKAGFWKCPYHNGRACMELIRRLGKIASAN